MRKHQLIERLLLLCVTSHILLKLKIDKTYPDYRIATMKKVKTICRNSV